MDVQEIGKEDSGLEESFGVDEAENAKDEWETTGI